VPMSHFRLNFHPFIDNSSPLPGTFSLGHFRFTSRPDRENFPSAYTRGNNRVSRGRHDLTLNGKCQLTLRGRPGLSLARFPTQFAREHATIMRQDRRNANPCGYRFKQVPGQVPFIRMSRKGLKRARKMCMFAQSWETPGSGRRKLDVMPRLFHSG